MVNHHTGERLMDAELWWRQLSSRRSERHIDWNAQSNLLDAAVGVADQRHLLEHRPSCSLFPFLQGPSRGSCNWWMQGWLGVSMKRSQPTSIEEVWDWVSWNPTDALPIAPLVVVDEGECEYERDSCRRLAWPARRTYTYNVKITYVNDVRFRT